MDDFYKNLPRKAMSAAALFFNQKGELLILKPTYKDHWGLPGGIGELYETPWRACIREIKEEIGLDILEKKNLLSVSYSFSKEKEREYIQFIFYGGVLDDKQIKDIKVDGSEISKYQFVKIKEVEKFLSEGTAKRAVKSVQALKDNKIVYIDE